MDSALPQKWPLNNTLLTLQWLFAEKLSFWDSIISFHPPNSNQAQITVHGPQSPVLGADFKDFPEISPCEYVTFGVRFCFLLSQMLWWVTKNQVSVSERTISRLHLTRLNLLSKVPVVYPAHGFHWIWECGRCSPCLRTGLYMWGCNCAVLSDTSSSLGSTPGRSWTALEENPAATCSLRLIAMFIVARTVVCFLLFVGKGNVSLVWAVIS